MELITKDKCTNKTVEEIGQDLNRKHLKRNSIEDRESPADGMWESKGNSKDGGQLMKGGHKENSVMYNKERKSKKISLKRRHSSPGRPSQFKKRRLRSRSRGRSHSPHSRRSLSHRCISRSISSQRCSSRSRSLSLSRSRRPAQKSHILDELFQLILAPTTG